MNRKGQTTSIWGIILILIVVGILLMYLMPLFFVASTLSAGQTGVYGFFVAFWPYFIIFFFILTILWKAYAG